MTPTHLFAAAALALAAFPAAADILADIKARGELKFGLEAQYRPFEFRDESGTIVGYDIDLGNAFAATLGVKAVPVDTNWSTVLQSLYNGEFDMILGGMTATQKRFERVDFSVPYMDAASGLLTMKGEGDAFAGLAGMAVGAGAGTPQIQQLTDCAAATGVTFEGEVQTFDNDALAYEALATGRIAGYASTLVSLLEAAKTDPDFAVTAWNCDGRFAGEWTAAAFRKEDDSLQAAFDAFILEAKKSGMLAELQTKWFGQSFADALPDTAPTW
jgi:ABC-type amino acid transport substrate-binding protein